MELPIHPTSLNTQILMFLARQKGDWCTYGTSFYVNSVQQVFPIGTSEDDQLSFMQDLQRRGLVGGCDCGCRGDYTITPKGLEMLALDCIQGRNEKETYLKEGFSFGY